MSEAFVVNAADLVVGYGAEPVVEGISISLRAGEAIALVGTNGSGKSNLLKTMLGLIPSLGGSLEILYATPGACPTRIAYLGQSHMARFVVPIRVVDVVRMGRFASLRLLGRTTGRDRRLVSDAMAHMEISHLADRPLRSLSGGQQQRVYLAQMLAHEADLLVLDEPTAGLDLSGLQRYRLLIDEALARGAALVTATHDIGEASACDQVLLLNRRIVAQGPPSEVLNADRLLETFGIALQGIEHGTHRDFMIGERPHGHDHE